MDLIRATTVVVPLLTLMACSGMERTDPTGQLPWVYISTLGDDTLTAESFVVDGSHVRGTLVERAPRLHRIDYELRLRPGSDVVERLDATISYPGSESSDGSGAVRWTVQIGDSLADIVTEREGESDSVTVDAGPGSLPSFGRILNAMVFFERAAREAVRAGADEYPVRWVDPLRKAAYPNAVTRHSPDTVSLSYFGFPVYAWLDADTTIAGVSARETTMRVETRRTHATDLDVLVESWSTREMAGSGLGPLSPAASETWTVGQATLTIDYGRPSRRGREIWGALVPYGEVWRTGANAATHLTVDRPVRVGDLDVPAGRYTLWSLYTPDSQELIVSSATDVWGTQYDPSRDFGRTAMRRSSAAGLVEQFTISVDAEDGGGTSLLALEWGDARFTVPVVER